MPKAFTEYEKELIGQRLLEQGYRLFSTYGLKKTTIEETAQAANIAKGTFYNFYESKEALFVDVAELAEKSYRQGVLAVIDRPGPSPRCIIPNYFSWTSLPTPWIQLGSSRSAISCWN